MLVLSAPNSAHGMRRQLPRSHSTNAAFPALGGGASTVIVIIVVSLHTIVVNLVVVSEHSYYQKWFSL